MAYPKELNLPAFFPDATYGTVHSVPLHLLPEQLDGVLVTTLYLHVLGLDKRPIASLIPWLKNKIVLSDSGGFQVFSLIHSKGQGQIDSNGARFKMDHAEIMLTPEFSQQIQHNIGSDIRVTLDYPVWGDENEAKLTESVKITTEWAARAKEEFLELLGISQKEFNRTKPKLEKHKLILYRPILIAVVQGGNNKDLRRKSAQELKKIGFDGYGFGGWPLKDGKLNLEIIKTFIDSFDSSTLLYGLGLGTPDDIVKVYKLGIHIFDCVLPTRNARHGLLFVSVSRGEPRGKNYDVLHIKSQRYESDLSPIDKSCNCPVCKYYTRAYVRLMLKTKNPVGYTLASLHNLWFYAELMKKLRQRGNPFITTVLGQES